MSKENPDIYDIIFFKKDEAWYTGISASWELSGSGVTKLADTFYQEYSLSDHLENVLRRSNGRLVVLFSPEREFEEEKVKAALIERYYKRKLSFLQRIFKPPQLEISFIERFRVQPKVERVNGEMKLSFHYKGPDTQDDIYDIEPQENLSEEPLEEGEFLLKYLNYSYIGPTFSRTEGKDFIFGSFWTQKKAEEVHRKWTRKMYCLHTPNLCLDGYSSTDEGVKQEVVKKISEFEALMDQEFPDAKSNLYRIPETASDEFIDRIYDILEVDYFQIVKVDKSKSASFGVAFNVNVRRTPYCPSHFPARPLA